MNNCFTQSACEADSSLCGDKGICIPNYQDDTVQCKCSDGFIGKPYGMQDCLTHRNTIFG